MECNSVCLGIKQFFGDLLSEVTLLVAIVISAVIATRIAISVYRDIRSKVREKTVADARIGNSGTGSRHS
jgi:hypothetical protein